MATLTPMISPCALTRAPPEFPGLMAASVWMTLMLMESWAAEAESPCWDPNGDVPWEEDPPSDVAEDAVSMSFPPNPVHRSFRPSVPVL
jgi:hypothetical protein